MQQLVGNDRPDAVLIAGPTASGKSALALRMAAMLHGEVVNADSIQVYEDLEVLTARPGPDDMASIPHRLFGHVDGAATYSTGHWLREVEDLLPDVWKGGSVPVIAGGTGLYFRALTDGLASMPEISRSTRETWRKRLAEEGTEALHRHLQAIDAEAAAVLPQSDRQRIVRALEVKSETGRSIVDWQRDPPGPGPLTGKNVVRIVLTMDRDILRGRIGERFDAMMAAGALDEVERLLRRRLDPELTVMKAIGVPQLSAALRGEMSLEDAVARAKIDSGRYAKRQDTWFRNQMAEGEWTRLSVTEAA